MTFIGLSPEILYIADNIFDPYKYMSLETIAPSCDQDCEKQRDKRGVVIPLSELLKGIPLIVGRGIEVHQNGESGRINVVGVVNMP